MPAQAGDRVQVTGTAKTGRVTQVTETSVVVLIAYQGGAVEVAEAFADEDLTVLS